VIRRRAIQTLIVSTRPGQEDVLQFTYAKASPCHHKRKGWPRQKGARQRGRDREGRDSDVAALTSPELWRSLHTGLIYIVHVCVCRSGRARDRREREERLASFHEVLQFRLQLVACKGGNVE
jgi:hypothetical protein